MGIEKRYQKLGCYRKLTPNYQDKLDRLIDAYADDLDAPIHVGDSLFTPHDFNHHCYNLYRIISENLCDLDIGGDRTKTLSEFELFLLDIAVLFHDCAMSSKVKLEVRREVHSADSAERFLKLWRDSESTLSKVRREANMSENDAKIVAAVIRAHSDDKSAPSPEKTGIFDEGLSDAMPSSDAGPVRAKFWAGILRLADELDITSDRLGDTRLKEQLDPGNADNRVSARHWKNLTYFSALRKSAEVETQLDLVLDEDAIREEIDKGNGDVVHAEIWKVKEKIDRELEKIKKEIFQKNALGRRIIRVETTAVSTRQERFKQPPQEEGAGDSPAPVRPGGDLDVPHGRGGTSLVKKSGGAKEETGDAPRQPAGESEKPAEVGVSVVSKRVQAPLDKFIVQQKLVETGHFRKNGTWCARDWINMTRVVEEPELLDNCVKAFAGHIYENMDLDGTIILGIDLNGTLLGVRVAAKLRCPFGLLVPPQELSGPDGRVDFSRFQHVIYITDVVVTGDMIARVTESYQLEEKVIGTYALLYRRPVPHEVPPEKGDARTAGAREKEREQLYQFKRPLYCISDSFDCELTREADCSWIKSETGCISRHKIVK